ncbi:spore cortex-lytic enzyme [Alkaliphilus hydrothermalis]|uniref:Spore cortex-lytic enzyme n=1 Tax=Alkaliphilus hydrothermalis TaxID=1482730 RepID=A0ABS2NSZ2_9FIRM|nr:spore cortex-lytic enzyme [Alkaliphilus hydrothermalis]MBM7616072.1 N-acetylmuramoyl-L-alanine amidase [Alkaliphilus hydrothermalis]
MKKYVLVLTVAFSLVLVVGLYINGLSAQNLSWGSRGEEVREVQSRLKRWGYMDGAVDGIYGADTYNGVIKFQRNNGLTADGVVGPSTRKALGISSKTTAPSDSVSRGVSRSDDINLLARIIHAEAKGEPYEGKVAVGAVILNRIESASFPNTLAGVVYQAGAFEPVMNGTINQPANDEAYKAARDALNGWDPTSGALYFWNPATATSKWIWSRKITLRIGDHVYGI